MTLQELIVKIGADIGDYTAGLDEAISKAESTKASFASIGATLSAGLTVPLTALGGAALKASTDIASAFREIRIGTGATGDALNGLKDTFRSVFADVDESAQEVGKVIVDLNKRLGLSGEPLEKLSKQVLDLVQIAGGDLSQTVEAMSKVFNAWSISTAQQSDALDYLFKVSREGQVPVGTLEQQLAEFGPTLKNLGLSFQDSALLLGNLGKQGIDVSAVMPGLRKEFTNLAKAGINGGDAFKYIVSGIQNGTITLQKAIDIFGERAAGTLFRVIRDGKLDVDAFGKSVNASGDTITHLAEQTETLSQAMSRAWHQVALALEPLGNVLKTALRTGFDDARPLLGVISDLGRSFGELPPQVQTAAVAIGALAAAAGPAALAIAGINSALASIGPAVAAAAPALGIAAFAFASLKIGGATDEIERFAEVVPDAFNRIKVSLGPAVDAIKAFAAIVTVAVIEPLPGFSSLSAAVEDLAGKLPKLKDIGKAIFDALVPFQAAVRDLFNVVSNEIQQIVAQIEYLTGRYQAMEDAARKNAGGAGPAPASAFVPSTGPSVAPAASATTRAPAATIDLSALGKGADSAVLSTDQLIRKQAELEQQVRKAEQVVADLTAREAAGAPVASALAAAHEQLNKALKEAFDRSTDVATIMKAALATQADSEARVNALNVAYRSLREAYDRTGEGAGALAEIHRQLDEALKKLGKSASDLAPALANIYAKFSDATQAFLKEQDTLEQAAEKQAGIFEEVRKGFEAGDLDAVQLGKAWTALKSALDSAGISAADLNTQVHLIGGGVPVITGGIQQIVQFGGAADKAINDINTELQKQGATVASVTTAAAVGIAQIGGAQKSIVADAEKATTAFGGWGAAINGSLVNFAQVDNAVKSVLGSAERQGMAFAEWQGAIEKSIAPIGGVDAAVKTLLADSEQQGAAFTAWQRAAADADAMIDRAAVHVNENFSVIGQNGRFVTGTFGDAAVAAGAIGGAVSQAATAVQVLTGHVKDAGEAFQAASTWADRLDEPIVKAAYDMGLLVDSNSQFHAGLGEDDTALRGMSAPFGTLDTHALNLYGHVHHGALAMREFGGALGRAVQMASQLDIALSHSAFTTQSLFGTYSKITAMAGPFELFDPNNPEKGGYTLSTSGPGLPYGGGQGYQLTYHEPFTPEPYNPPSAGGAMGPGGGTVPVHDAELTAAVNQTTGAVADAAKAVQYAGQSSADVMAAILKLMAETGQSYQDAAKQYYQRNLAGTQQLVSTTDSLLHVDGMVLDVAHMTTAEIQNLIQQFMAQGLTFEQAAEKLGGKVVQSGAQVAGAIASSSTSVVASIGGIANSISSGLSGIAKSISELNQQASSGQITEDQFVRQAQAMGYTVTEAVAAQTASLGGVAGAFDALAVTFRGLIAQLQAEGLSYADALSLIQQEQQKGLSNADIVRQLSGGIVAGPETVPAGLAGATGAPAATTGVLEVNRSLYPSSGPPLPQGWQSYSPIFNPEKFLPPPAPAPLTLPAGAVQERTVVNIINPTVLNRSMLDELARQVWDSGIRR